MRLVDIEPIVELVKKEHERVQDRFNKANIWEEPNSVARYSEALLEVGAFIGLMINAPTVDAVPVIRCKDCTKYRQGMTVTEWYFCSVTGALVDGQDFCSWAERKEDGTV
ncbi:hypothetical protein [Ruminobacter sp.]|uniref:hypothetical protein n=1 Tax=Ruminobacter sp. TaxID=2774296 RepID=UPI0038703CAD